ncbi:hypothetical protein BB560_004576, partial [Smittium megazygosporum]
MVRNDKKAAQINEELQDLLGLSYNSEFGHWVEAESKNPKYYQSSVPDPAPITNNTSASLEIPIDENTSSQQQSQDDSQSQRNSPPERSKPKLHSNNRLFEKALSKSNSSYSRRRKDSVGSRERGSRERYPRERHSPERHSKGRFSNSSSDRMNSEILSRLGKVNKSSGRVEKKHSESTSPAFTTIKGIAKSSNSPTSKPSILSRLGPRDESAVQTSINNLAHPMINPSNISMIKSSLYNPHGAQSDAGVPIMGFPVNHARSFEDNPNNRLPESLVGLKKIKCANWPMCNLGSSCEYFHPTKICPKFPNCPNTTAECMYIHPHVQKNQLPHNSLHLNNSSSVSSIPCKFGIGCLNPNCQFSHPPERVVPQINTVEPGKSIPILCKFYPNCKNPYCPYLHTNENPSIKPTLTNTQGDSDTSLLGNNTLQAQVPGQNNVAQNKDLGGNQGISQGTGQSQKPGSLCDPSKKVPIQCRNGANCTRLDCHFMHPEDQAIPSIP